MVRRFAWECCEVAVRYSDQEIEELIRERKPLPQDCLSLIQFKPKLGHKEYDLNVRGDNGSDFRLILRQSRSNRLNFSVILGIIPVNTNQLFRLRRYNGKHSQHTNRIEKNKFYDFHIHLATERYQQIGVKEDEYAEPTDRFADFHTALQCMLDDCNFDVPEDPQLSFLQGV
jgi:hypothetical protein